MKLKRQDSGQTAASRRLLTVAEAGVFLGCSAWTVRSLVWRGDLPEVRVGRLVRLDVRDLEEFIGRNKVTNGLPNGYG